jgi:hypothetical protein
MKSEMTLQLFVRTPNVKFNQNSSSGSLLVETCTRHTDTLHAFYLFLSCTERIRTDFFTAVCNSGSICNNVILFLQFLWDYSCLNSVFRSSSGSVSSFYIVLLFLFTKLLQAPFNLFCRTI